MKLNELTTEYEQHKVFMYAADGNKVVRHNKQMRKFANNVYAGAPESDGWENRVDIYLVFDGVECGLKVYNFRADCEAQDVLDDLRRCSVDTIDRIIEKVNRAIKEGDHIPMLYVEFIRQFKLDLVPAMMEARRQREERIERKAQEAATRRKAEEEAFIKEKNDLAEQTVNKAIEILRNGGILVNDDVVIYKSRYDSSTYSVVNYLCRKYGVKLPLRTAGWVNECLANLRIENDKCENLQYYMRKKTTKASEVIYSYINQLIAAVKAS